MDPGCAFHILVTATRHSYFCVFPQPFRDGEKILHLKAIGEQAGGWIWLGDCV
jgi:hypothetical protein